MNPQKKLRLFATFECFQSFHDREHGEQGIAIAFKSQGANNPPASAASPTTNTGETLPKTSMP